MFAEQLRRAVEASPRAELPAVCGLLWKAFAAGQVSEPEAAQPESKPAPVTAKPETPAAPEPRAGMA